MHQCINVRQEARSASTLSDAARGPIYSTNQENAAKQRDSKPVGTFAESQVDNMLQNQKVFLGSGEVERLSWVWKPRTKLPSSSPAFPAQRAHEAVVDIDKVFWHAFNQYQQQLQECAELETLEKRNGVLYIVCSPTKTKTGSNASRQITFVFQASSHCAKTVVVNQTLSLFSEKDRRTDSWIR